VKKSASAAIARYEYLGQRYTAETPDATGDTVRVRVDVSPAF
jgi:hypothetical protein